MRTREVLFGLACALTWPGCAELGRKSAGDGSTLDSPLGSTAVPIDDRNSPGESGGEGTGTSASPATASPSATGQPSDTGQPSGTEPSAPTGEDPTDPSRTDPAQPDAPDGVGIGDGGTVFPEDQAVFPEDPDEDDAGAGTDDVLTPPGSDSAAVDAGTEWQGAGLDPRLVPAPASAGPVCTDFSPFSRECTEAFHECRPRTADEGRCERYGSNTRGDPCARSADCWTGLSCFDGVCRELCELDFPTCLGLLDCTPIGHPAVGICLP